MNKDFLAAILGKALGAMDDATLGQFLREAMIQKSRGANNLDPGEIVRDLFLEGDMNKVPSKTQIEVTAPVSASGGGLDNMMERFSDPATMLRHIADYDKVANMLGELKDSVKAMADANKTLAEGMAALLKKSEEEEEESAEKAEEEEEEEEEEESDKSLASAVARSILNKSDEEEEDSEQEEGGINIAVEEEEEESEEEEEGKSLAATSQVKFAKAMLAGAKEALKKGASRTVQEGAAKSLRRALALATLASKSKEKDVAKNAKSVLEAIQEAMFLYDIPVKAKKARKDSLPANGNQEKWPDKEKVGKAEAQLVKMETDLHTLMNTVANLSRVRNGGEPKAIVGNPLQKANANYFADKAATILAKAEGSLLSETAQGEAEELLSLMQAAKLGRIDETVVKNAVSVSSAEVKALFPEWLGQAA